MAAPLRTPRFLTDHERHWSCAATHGPDHIRLQTWTRVSSACSVHRSNQCPATSTRPSVGLEGNMRNIVDEAGEIIAKASDDHTLVGGHHRLAVAASLGRKLFWKDTGEPVKLDPFFKGSSHRPTA
jgi:hypothetical protein